MGAAAYNRGSAKLSLEINAALAVSGVASRMERAAESDERASLLARVRRLERQLRRAELSLRITSATLTAERSERVAENALSRLAVRWAFSAGVQHARMGWLEPEVEAAEATVMEVE